MKSPHSQVKILAVSVAGIFIAVCVSAQTGGPMVDFEAENTAAMNKMMAGMAIKYSKDVDRDFARMMIPHHQGAIDMAVAELRYGHNEQLRRIAQEIVVDQLQEIAAMRLALGDPLPAPIAAPTDPGEAEATSAPILGGGNARLKP